MLQHHNREQFEVFCYSQTVHIDERTDIFKSFASHWKTIERLNDDEVTALIRSDAIDILVDTAGHFGGNRLEVFANRAVPLQISGIGYPGSTGLAAIDYRISDTIIDPPKQGRVTLEKPILLENGFCCYMLPPTAPPVAPLPACTNRYITFGSLHTTARLNRETIALWSLVLKNVPSARLIICRNTLTPTVISRLSAWFLEDGITLSRIEFRPSIPSAGHLSVYNDIDITLDTIPWSGHTTACESLAMGLPVVTLCGSRHAGRMVSSVLTFSHLSRLIASNENEFVGNAKKLAEDIAELAKMRASLRSHILASPLCDGRGYMLSLEEKYRSIWKDWCATH
jgi:predicted O-linked N-acetylglucosamine transferase (SPINDLY family)